MIDNQPYHETEVALQLRTGRRGLAEALAPRIWPEIAQEVIEFLPTLPFVVVGSLDDLGRPWASILCGKTGFLEPAPGSLRIAALPHHGDPLTQNLRSEGDIGAIGIDFLKRRRFRINGRARSDGEAINVEVKQCYRNCPQYIHAREATYDAARPAPLGSRRRQHLDPEACEIIAKADTFFIASHGSGRAVEDPRLGADVSHRAGNPGFVTIDRQKSRISFPDYIGNFMFNTLGNLTRYPRCGILFVDFENGTTLQLTGRANVDWELDRVTAVPGAQRMVDVEVEETILTENALALSWLLIQPAPDLQRYRTPSPRGSSSRGAGFTGCMQPEDGFFPVTVTKVVDDADRFRSFYLRPTSGRLEAYKAGQHIRLQLPDGDRNSSIIRNYSLSSFDPAPEEYRIGVRRSEKGPLPSGSNWLHDNIEVGSEILISAPAGSFVLNEQSDRPIALVSAGSGITPMLSMLNALIHLRTTRDVWFIHGARHGAEHAYASEVRRLSDRLPNVTAHFRYSRPRDLDFMGRDHDSVGRIDPAFLTDLVPEDADFYLCGPRPFMSDVKSHLSERGVPADRIHLEAFGAAGDQEHADPGLLGARVRFAEDDREFVWDGNTSSLLELAEKGGLTPLHSCRAGTCGSCEHVLREGAVSYSPQPLFEAARGNVLLCCARPQTDVTVGPSTYGAP